MKVKFNLAENVVMTDTGLMKKCNVCGRYLPLNEYNKSEKNAFLRQHTCKDCIKELRKRK